MGKIKFKIVLFLLVLAIGRLYAEEEVFTEGDFKYTVENGKASITDYNGDDEILIISKKLGGYEVTSIGSEAFSWCTSLTAIEIPDSVTTIGDYAFSYCRSLTSIEIPNSVTTIGDYAFSSCDSLTAIEIPNSVTTIGKEAFYNCESLTAIVVSKNNPVYSFIEGVLFDKQQNMLHTYLSSNKEISYAIPSGITTIEAGAFYKCTSLTSIEIPDSVTTIGQMAFYGCYNLTAIAVSKNNPVYSFIEGVLFDKQQKMLHTYLASNKKTSYTIPNGITTIGDFAFFSCNSLTSIEIPDSVTTIGGGAFFGCDNLTAEIPDSVTTIGQRAFYGCSSLTSMRILDSVTTIGDLAFFGCNNLTITIENEDSYAHKYAQENDINYVFAPDTSWLD